MTNAHVQYVLMKPTKNRYIIAGGLMRIKKMVSDLTISACINSFRHFRSWSWETNPYSRYLMAYCIKMPTLLETPQIHQWNAYFCNSSAKIHSSGILHLICSTARINNITFLIPNTIWICKHNKMSLYNNHIFKKKNTLN